jgi:immune inhibitor A
MGDPCFVAPHPELLKEMIAKFNELKDRASQELPIMRSLLRLREPRSPGFNDGLLHLDQDFAPQRAPLTGAINVVVILVDFADKQFTAGTQTAAHYKDLWFGVGNNSVNDFYREVSDDKVEITGEVVGPYRLPHPIAYYANGEYGVGYASPNSRTMATDAATLAKGSVDFAKYDNDGDGTVETLVIVHAGQGAERTGNVNDIWSHKWALSSYVQDDGVTLFPYLTVPADCKLGVCAHELGHLAFNWPDLYDADYSSAGIGNWCLMAAGSYNGNENNPSPPSAWCKVDQAWVTVTTISKSSQ